MATPTRTDLSQRHGSGAMKPAVYEAPPDSIAAASDASGVSRSTLRYDYDQIAPGHRERVMRAAQVIHEAEQTVRENVFRVGEELNEVKKRLGYRQFGEWLRAEFDMSERTAERMMTVAKRLGDKTDTVSVFSDSVLYLLAAPSTPDEVRERVEAKFNETGIAPTRAEVKAVRDKIRQPHPAPAKVSYLVPPVPDEPDPDPPSDEEIAATIEVAQEREQEDGERQGREAVRADRAKAAWADVRDMQKEVEAVFAPTPEPIAIAEPALLSPSFSAMGAEKEGTGDSDMIQLTLSRGLVRKLQHAVLRGVRLRDMFTPEEMDKLNVVCSKALTLPLERMSA